MPPNNHILNVICRAVSAMLPMPIYDLYFCYQLVVAFFYFTFFILLFNYFCWDLHFVFLFFACGINPESSTYRWSTREEAVWSSIKLLLAFVFFLLPIAIFWIVIIQSPLYHFELMEHLFARCYWYHFTFYVFNHFFLVCMVYIFSV